jgi:hypothetical protein
MSTEKKFTNPCRYCGEHEAIENSHIIPAYVFRWLKDTSATKQLRGTDEPNLRVQDGPKKPILCPKCEGEFSVFEEIFGRQVFRRVANYRVPCPPELEVSRDSQKCILSIAWRVMAEACYLPLDHQYTPEELSEFPKLLQNIKNNIDKDVPTAYKVHIIPCLDDIIKRVGLPLIDRYYYERAIGGAEVRIWDNWERLIVHIKIPFLIIIVELIPGANDVWSGTEVLGTGKLVLNDIRAIPEYLSDTTMVMYETILRAVASISDEQREVIRKSFENADSDSGTFKTLRKGDI